MQQKFAEEYLIDLNATEAAKRAGYSSKTAESQGCRLLTNVKVQSEIERLRKNQSERTNITADTVLQELLRIARTDIEGAFTEDMTLKPLHKIPEDIRRAIAGVEIFEEFQGKGKDREFIGYTKKVKFWEKTKALELLGKHLKLFTDNINVSGTVKYHRVATNVNAAD